MERASLDLTEGGKVIEFRIKQSGGVSRLTMVSDETRESGQNLKTLLAFLFRLVLKQA